MAPVRTHLDVRCRRRTFEKVVRQADEAHRDGAIRAVPPDYFESAVRVEMHDAAVLGELWRASHEPRSHDANCAISELQFDEFGLPQEPTRASSPHRFLDRVASIVRAGAQRHETVTF